MLWLSRYSLKDKGLTFMPTMRSLRPHHHQLSLKEHSRDSAYCKGKYLEKPEYIEDKRYRHSYSPFLLLDYGLQHINTIILNS